LSASKVTPSRNNKPSPAQGYGWPKAPGSNKFIGTCQLSGTIPTGWTVSQASFSTLSATDGSANAGTFEWGPQMGDTAFSDAGTFINSGRFVDEAAGLSQAIAVRRFVNTGVLQSSAPDMAIDGPASGPACSSCTFINRASVELGQKSVLSSGSKFIMTPRSVIDAVGTFDIANMSTFDVEGGTVSGGPLGTSQFLNQGPATIEFTAPGAASSTGKIDVSTNVNLQGVVPRRWAVYDSSGSVTAVAAGNDGTFEWTSSADNSALSSTSTFVNSGTFVDSAAGLTQEISLPRFVNDGTVISNAPAFGISVRPGVPSDFVDNGTVLVGPKGGFNAAGTLVLDRGGLIEDRGSFDIGGTVLELDGGSIKGKPPSNPYHLGSGTTTLDFVAPSDVASSGTLDVQTLTDVQGQVPAHWQLDVTGGGLAVDSVVNGGTIEWATSSPLTVTGTFGNTGTMDLSGSMYVSGPGLANRVGGHVVVAGTGSVIRTSGIVTNEGSLMLGPGAEVSAGGYTQGTSGSLGVALASPTSFGSVAVSGEAT
jgi:hypothetical protein